jgi:lysophospholipase L1-like esterase
MPHVVRFLVAGLLFPAGTAFSQSEPGATAEPRDAAWLKRHEGFVAEAKNGGIDVLFVGDSITDAWRTEPALAIWKERFAPLKAANFGISGDRTQHVLWRLRNGELQGITPKVLVLLIGTNNIGQARPEPPASAVAGIKAILKEVKDRSPRTKMLLIAVFPRGEKPDHPHRAAVKEINTSIKSLDDGGKSVRYLDIEEKFVEPDGTISKEIMPDFLHLSGKGYAIWADAIREPLVELLK